MSSWLPLEICWAPWLRNTDPLLLARDSNLPTSNHNCGWTIYISLRQAPPDWAAGFIEGWKWPRPLCWTFVSPTLFCLKTQWMNDSIITPRNFLLVNPRCKTLSIFRFQGCFFASFLYDLYLLKNRGSFIWSFLFKQFKEWIFVTKQKL